MAPPAPVIQTSSSSVVVGENLRVSCSVVGEQNVGVEFNWEYPGQQVSHSGRVNYTSSVIACFVFLASLLLVKRHSTYGLQSIQAYNYLLLTYQD